MQKRVLITAIAFTLLSGIGVRGALAEDDANAGDVAALATLIDEHVEAVWRERNVQPAAMADDAEFIRRVYLDVGGRIPTAWKVRQFLADRTPDKRARLVEELLAGENYVRHFSRVWRQALIPEADSDRQVLYVSWEFDAWMRERVAKNTPYDQFVRQILTVPLSGGARNDPYAFFDGQGPAQPTAFFAAKQVKPEILAASTARVFMGIRVDCAECHDHPFAPWTREQFWSYAAFFGGIQRPSGRNPLRALTELFTKGDPNALKLTIPGTDTQVPPRYLDGIAPDLSGVSSPRNVLADWLVGKDNPYFARNAVNRLWAHFYGLGLVDPVDDMESTNLPSHPELLDELARQFVEHDFDVQFIIRAITSSRTYQLSGKLGGEPPDPRIFARMQSRLMTPDQLYDSLGVATGRKNDNVNEDPYFEINQISPRSRFQSIFNAGEQGPHQRQASVLQALSLMNGKLVADATTLETGGTLVGVAEMPLATTAQRVESLYLATLSRMPTEEELQRLVEYVEAGASPEDSMTALSDVFWVLLNSTEFGTNH